MFFTVQLSSIRNDGSPPECLIKDIRSLGDISVWDDLVCEQFAVHIKMEYRGSSKKIRNSYEVDSYERQTATMSRAA